MKVEKECEGEREGVKKLRKKRKKILCILKIRIIYIRLYKLDQFE